MSAKKKAPAKKGAAAPIPQKQEEKAKCASWLVARFRNALHFSRPELKKDKTLKGVSTLSDIREALGMTREEWEALLERFFNLGGKLEEKKA